MNEFKVGNCVGLPKTGYNTWEEFYNSQHILCETDIARGYYWCNNGSPSIDLSNCIHHSVHLNYRNRNRCQTLKGKVTQPCNWNRFVEKYTTKPPFERPCNDGITVSCYIMFKGITQRIEGEYWKGQVYFFGMNNVFYKTKVYVTEEGYLTGLHMYGLSDKQKRNSTKF